MKILRTKTYNKMLLKIRKLENLRDDLCCTLNVLTVENQMLKKEVDKLRLENELSNKDK